MTKEEALQKVNDYCNEKSYTAATLTDGFKDKFAEHLAKRYPDAAADDETALGDMKFALNSAFSGASLIITDKTKEFETKENGYKSQIAELEKKVPKPNQKPNEVVLPKEVQEKLDAYDKFMDGEKKTTKFKNIMELAKKGIRQNLHASFEKFATDYDVKLDKEDKEQADALVTRFKEIFKDSIGDIAPLAPQQTQKRDEDFIASLKKVKVQ
jgi:hypothetical protein